MKNILNLKAALGYSGHLSAERDENTYFHVKWPNFKLNGCSTITSILYKFTIVSSTTFELTKTIFSYFLSSTILDWDTFSCAARFEKLGFHKFTKWL